MRYPLIALIVCFLGVYEGLNSFRIQRWLRKKSCFLVITIHTRESS